MCDGAAEHHPEPGVVRLQPCRAELENRVTKIRLISTADLFIYFLFCF